MPDTVNDNRFGKFNLPKFSMNVIESYIVTIHYSDTAEDLFKSINPEFLPINNSDFNASLSI